MYRYRVDLIVDLHRGAHIRCDITTDRAGQLDMCGAALLSLQDHLEYYHYDGRMPLGSSHGGDRGSREWTDGYAM